MSESVTRPLFIIFLTIFVNLIGFGIIIPLLPFYAQTFGASPFVIGLLFAAFSICQLVAAPALGDLSDRYGRRPVLIFSLAGTVVSFAMLAAAHSVAMLFAARIVDGLSGGNISTARAYVADVTEPKDREGFFYFHACHFFHQLFEKVMWLSIFIIYPPIGGTKDNEIIVSHFFWLG